MLVIGNWIANQEKTKKGNESRPSPFPKLDGNLTLEFSQQQGSKIVTKMRSSAGVALFSHELEAGTGEGRFQYGDLDIHFLNKDRFVLYRPRHADVILDRVDKGDQ